MDTETTERLKSLVVKHHVCWDVAPMQASTRQGIHPIGYEIHLLGVHDDPHPDVLPGCPHCRQVYEDLYALARGVLPPPESDVTCTIEEYDGALRFSTSTHAPPAVRLVIEVHHRAAWDAPVDPSEHRCVKRITTVLTDLGVPHRRYPRW